MTEGGMAQIMRKTSRLYYLSIEPSGRGNIFLLFGELLA